MVKGAYYVDVTVVTSRCDSDKLCALDFVFCRKVSLSSAP